MDRDTAKLADAVMAAQLETLRTLNEETRRIIDTPWWQPLLAGAAMMALPMLLVWLLAVRLST
jgi:hypothetical protein